MAFFTCSNCRKIWQYPIEKCPHCFSQIQRLPSQKARVIACSRVSLSSLFHFRVPYYLLILEDENKNRWIEKSFQEYHIGEEIQVLGKKDKEAVAIWRVKYDFKEAIEKVVELLGGININEKSKILILPTLEKASHPYFRDNTSPEFLEATINFLFELGVKSENIKVAAQTFDDIPLEQKAVKSGLLAVCQNKKVLPLNLAEGKFLERGDLKISEEAFSNDLIINLPILKVEKAQATENLFFFLQKENLLSQKYLFSEKEILEKLKKELPSIFTLAEANHIHDEKGLNHYLNIVLGSFNPQFLDSVFFKIIRRKPPEILEEISKEISIVGRKIEEVEFPL